MRLLFVCSGNTCRSPMAQALAKARIERLGLPWTTASAGLSPWPGSPASEEAVREMTRRGLSLAGHHAAPADPAAAAQADHILTMTRAQRDALRLRFPRLSNRIRTLGEAAGRPGDVQDPYGRDAQAYRACADQLDELVTLALRALGPGSEE